MGGQVLGLGECDDVMGDVGERVARVVDDVDAAQEGLDGEPRGVAGAPAGRQDVVGAGAVVAERDRRVRAHEDRARVADPGGDGGGVGGLDLQVLGAVRVDDPQALLHAVDQHDRGLLARKGGRDALLDVLGGGGLRHQFLLDRVGQFGAVGDEDGGGERVVLGLADQVGGDMHRVGGGVREDGDLGRAGLGVDADAAGEVALGGGDPDVAGPGDHVGGRTAVGSRRAVREHRDGLGAAAAYTSSTPSSAQAARIVGCGRPPNSFWGGEASAIEPTPASCAGTTFMITEDGYTARPPGA